jgi:hypothetical protein
MLHDLLAKMLPMERVSEVSRRLRSRCDAVLAAVWFMPEAGEIGLGGRAACMGAISGASAAALFAPQEPTGVARAVDDAWTRTTPAALLAERLRASVAYLERVLGPEPDGIERALELLRPAATAGSTEGHPVYAGLRSLGWTDSGLGDLWRACDLVRERRGDSHRNAWVAAGADPAELCVLTDLWRGASIASTSATWSKDALAAAAERLRARGYVDDDGITPGGRAFRDDIELATDRQERAALETLGDDVDELFTLMAPWARAVIESATGPGG